MIDSRTSWFRPTLVRVAIPFVVCSALLPACKRAAEDVGDAADSPAVSPAVSPATLPAADAPGDASASSPRTKPPRSPRPMASDDSDVGAGVRADRKTEVDADPKAQVDADVARVAELLTGWFDSVDQSIAAPDDFFEIRLVMVPIWPERTDGRWFYVEQAAMSALGRPYRQRVYHVHRDAAAALRSDVYTLPGDPLEHAACWTKSPVLGDVARETLELREGCSIVLEPDGPDAFRGATVGEGCASTLRDAAYATSEVRLTPGLLVSWDRGWTAAGEQAWGAVKGGYEFVRRGVEPPAEPDAAVEGDQAGDGQVSDSSASGDGGRVGR